MFWWNRHFQFLRPTFFWVKVGFPIWPFPASSSLLTAIAGVPGLKGTVSLKHLVLRASTSLTTMSTPQTPVYSIVIVPTGSMRGKGKIIPASAGGLKLSEIVCSLHYLNSILDKSWCISWQAFFASVYKELALKRHSWKQFSVYEGTRCWASSQSLWWLVYAF